MSSDEPNMSSFRENERLSLGVGNISSSRLYQESIGRKLRRERLIEMDEERFDKGSLTSFLFSSFLLDVYHVINTTFYYFFKICLFFLECTFTPQINTHNSTQMNNNNNNNNGSKTLLSHTEDDLNHMNQTDINILSTAERLQQYQGF